MWLGIDFGTCNSSAALLLDGMLKRIAEPLKHGYCFPSSVFFTAQGEILVGHAAENARQKDPQRYRHEFKRDLGSEIPFSLGNCQLLPEELLAEVIRKLKVEADLVVKGRGIEPLSDAIITVPATYQAYKRDMMQKTGIDAGFSQVKLLEEPVAAAIYYSRHAPVEEEEIILVYDLGGGTFDATLIQKEAIGYKILAMPKGLPHCGGKDFDQEIYQDLKSQCSEFLRQRLEDKKDWRIRAIVGDFCRQIKHQLSEAEEAQVYIPIGDGESYALTRQAFNGMIEPLIGETIDCCDQLVRSAGLEWRQVERVLLVGGSCRIPYVQETIEEKFGRPHLLVDEPELAVCLGAAIYGASLEPEKPLETETAEAYLKRGLQQSSAGDYRQAIEEFNQALRLNPTCSEAHYNVALAHSKLGEHQWALEGYEQALRLNPRYAEAYLNRGNVHYRLNQLREAMQDYESALAINPNLTAATKYRELVLSKLKDSSESKSPSDNTPPKVEENKAEVKTEAKEQQKESCQFEVELRSERGVDYTRLRELLAAGKWGEADRETAMVMLKASGRENKGYLEDKDLETFPCADLHIIDQLWESFSQGRFGFSVQKRIYQRLEGTNKYKLWQAFGDRVGWRVGNEWVKNYSDLTFDLTAPAGHLPSALRVGGTWENMWWVGALEGVSSLAQRLADCSVIKPNITPPKVEENKAEVKTEAQEQQKESRQFEVELRSERGVDYTRLRELLAAGKWREADRETARIVRKVADPRKNNRTAPIKKNFPCQDLCTINGLWVKYSNGRFGFSVQNKIWQACGSSTSYDENWVKFCRTVGWIKGLRLLWCWIPDKTFDLTAPQGHLPSVLAPRNLPSSWEMLTNFPQASFMSHLASRLAECNIQV
jgi:tetratricopeptide (TPR) repeat protein